MNVVLGIETSCDETSAAIMKDGELLSNIVYSQKIHIKYGGVVPEYASREHEKNLINTIKESLCVANLTMSDLDAIAVTYGPGLLGSLLVGLNMAKGLSIGLDIPFVGVNHMEGHLFANMIGRNDINYPYLCLLVSGGHTQIWEVEADNYNLISDTIDDAAGEAFDKGAKILGLKYPGGPEIQKASIGGNPERYNFPRPQVKKSKFNFSFSGLKTSLLYKCRDMNDKSIKDSLSDLSASYQEAIVDTLINKLELAINETGINTVSIAGGVAANKRFREKTSMLVDKYQKLSVIFPDMEFCTDNAAMIAAAGYNKIIKKQFSNYDLTAVPNLSLNNG
ncbi:MAG: tRNA (adenosine(37)-N6)-threonylcarbamoyltransferase complex transferase subunit TsaD [Candidatus Marinimicrobia bacterium]|nr:tRNA (adenosine(37)-N6)-threonylcarbamoyltransferase complex transferase subunit TsaD [Candidatus Neomarinimicrobiota bacterium]